MNQQEELEALRASESIKHANLQELARLVLEYSKSSIRDNASAYDAMLKFARGVAQ